MTTPEHFRRRQLVEGVVILLLAIFTVVQSISFGLEDRDQRDEDRAQRECFEEKFSELSTALDARSELNSRESAANRRIWDVWARAAGLVKDDPTKPLPPKEQVQLQQDLVDALLSYQETMQYIRAQRQDNPVPPYPVGVCGKDQ